jgi:hypothetical protein
MKVVNSGRSTIQSDVIQSFSDENRFVASGIAKGHTTECYSWIADMRAKATNNTFINPHSAYVAFYSDREIMYQEFGNVEKIYQEYPFVSDVARQLLPPHFFELNRKQYATISNKSVEFDQIEYLNISDQMKISQEQVEQSPELYSFIKYHHGYWRSPAFYSTGYRINLDDVHESVEFYDKYYWASPSLVYSVVKLEGCDLDIGEFWSDVYDPYNSAFNEIRDLIGDVGDDLLLHEYSSVKRVVDVKFNVANQKFFYFTNSYEWVCYYNDSNHYSNREYSPYYGLVNFYFTNTAVPSTYITGTEDWQQIHPDRRFSPSLSFYPQIIRGQNVEPAKIISYWGRYQSGYAYTSGQMAINMGVTNGESDDQSRIVYSACRHMISPIGATFAYSVHKKVDTEYLYGGIDIDTERNRRHSAVVMTEPYMVTVPICDGELVKYAFVDPSGAFISSSNEFDHDTNNAIYLKIKASKSVIAELDRLIKGNDTNTDIINTLTINNILGSERYQQLLTDAKYYNNFRDATATTKIFMERQDDCVDDLVGIDGSGAYGVAGNGMHKEFVIPTFSLVTASKYTNSLMKVNGIGFVSRMVYDSTLNVWSPISDLKVYCSNYSAKSAPAPGDEEPIANEVRTFIASPASLISTTSDGEKFFPMIRLSGMNGYIKIIERNQAFKITRDRSGMYEVVYSVEFPYCPGSYSERVLMDFSGTDPYRETWILKKESYINAGSRSAVSVGYPVSQRLYFSNDRYAPFADDSFCAHSVLYQKDTSGSTYTAQYKNGGGAVDANYNYQQNLVKHPAEKNLVKYPADLVWVDGGFLLLSLIKPRVSWARRYGTYDINVTQTNRDIKLFGLFDNRKWKFANNRFSSYIDRENPAHVYEIDISSLFEDFSINQKDDASIPDIKRWLYGYFSGFAHMMLGPDMRADDTAIGDDGLVITEKINTIRNGDLTSEESQSNIIIEIWDDRSNIGPDQYGNDKSGNWRPAVSISTDTQKSPGKIIIDNVNISHYQYSVTDGIHKVFPNPSDPTGSGVYYATIGYVNIVDTNFNFPNEINYGVGGEDVLSERSNLVLYDKENMWSYHVIYAKSIGDPDSIGRQLYKVYFYRNSTDPIMPILDAEDVDLNNVGPFAIYEPKKQISKNISFDLSTSEAMQGIEDNIVKRFFDIRSGVDNRYIVDQKLYFRTRVVRKKSNEVGGDSGQYDQSYTSVYTSTIQYNGSTIDNIENPDHQELSNFPWFNSQTEEYDTEFDWKKIVSNEIVRKLGSTYFKCASK